MLFFALLIVLAMMTVNPAMHTILAVLSHRKQNRSAMGAEERR